MKLCNDTITVFNHKLDMVTGFDVYNPVIITGVSWYSRIISSVDTNGLHAADSFVVRIPVTADFGGKTYVDPITYKNANIVTQYFTFLQGDIVVKGAVETAPSRISDIHANYHECFTILGVNDNRRAPNAPHWKVVGS